MTTPFDPRWWLPGVGVRGPGSGGGQGPVTLNWLDTWADLTTWWIEPAISAAESWRAHPEQLLAQLVEGLASQFGGRPVDVEVRGHRVRAILDSLRLLPRRAGSYELRVDATDAVVEGLQVDRLDAVVRSVRLEPGLNPKLVGTDVEVSGKATLSALVAWIDDRVSGWSLTVDDDGSVFDRPGTPGGHSGESALPRVVGLQQSGQQATPSSIEAWDDLGRIDVVL